MARGICNLSIIPVRAEPSSSSELLTQLLFGETYAVLEQQEGWIKVHAQSPEYEGWISRAQFCALAVDGGRPSVVTEIPCVDAFCTATKNSLYLSPGSLVYDLNNHDTGFAEYQCNGIRYKTLTEPDMSSFGQLDATNLVAFAMNYLDVPYLWGGRTPFGIDCSGFTHAVFRVCGIELRRDAWQQAEMGEPVSFVESAQDGDLAFFDNEAGRITHVGIICGPNRIIHASGRVRVDKLDSHGIFNEQTNSYSHKLRIIKRIT